MARNTKEVALIQVRSGNMSELPKSLHQSEFGFAVDTNRLFIGNPQSDLKNRTKFPYQNVEILTESSVIDKQLKYRYENNIKHAVDNGKEINDRLRLKEYLPIVLKCSKENPVISSTTNTTTIALNNKHITFDAGDNLEAIILTINSFINETGVYAVRIDGSNKLNLISFAPSVSVENITGNFIEDVDLPREIPTAANLPERIIPDKLDDFLIITDFGIKGDGYQINGGKIYESLLEVYKNITDNQSYRKVMMPAGTYLFDSNENLEYVFPLVSNLHVQGEGVDRTIVKCRNYQNAQAFVVSIDEGLRTPFEANIKETTMSDNVIVEDMTFEGNTGILVKILSGRNITFNRVKFKGNGQQDLVKLCGSSAMSARNIIFNQCIFENANNGLNIEYNTENITVENCLFKDIKNYAVKIGEDLTENGLNRAITLATNTFTNCGKSLTTDKYVIWVGKNSEYVSIYQSKFDKEVFDLNNNGENVLRPYRDFKGSSRTNFIDTLDPKTDTKKWLRFTFAQPQWDYISYLCNAKGQVIVVVDENDSAVTSPNGLNIKQDGNKVTIKSVGSGNMVLSQITDSDLYLGYNEKDASGKGNGFIILKKNLKLDDHNITNEGGKADTILTPATDKIIRIQNNSTTPYTQLILNQPDAVPTVAFVKGQSSNQIIKTVTYKDLDSSNKVNLITFDKNIYGDSLYLKQITISANRMFNKSYKNRSSAIEYKVGLTYYEGETVKNQTKYAVVMKEHKAVKDYNGAKADGLLVELSTVELNDMNYVDVIASKPNESGSTDNYRLTMNHNMNLLDLNNDYWEYTAKITSDNTIINAPTIDTSKTYKKGDVVSFQGLQFLITKEGTLTPSKQIEELHDKANAKLLYNTGKKYVYDFDRDVIYGMDNMVYNGEILNLAGSTFSLDFNTENRLDNLGIGDKTQLCPSGELIIRIDYSTSEILK